MSTMMLPLCIYAEENGVQPSQMGTIKAILKEYIYMDLLFTKD